MSSRDLATPSQLDLIRKGMEVLREAGALDRDGKGGQAVAKYTQGLESLLLALKSEKNPRTSERLRTKIMETMTRCEKLNLALVASRGIRTGGC